MRSRLLTSAAPVTPVTARRTRPGYPCPRDPCGTGAGRWILTSRSASAISARRWCSQPSGPGIWSIFRRSGHRFGVENATNWSAAARRRDRVQPRLHGLWRGDLGAAGAAAACSAAAAQRVAARSGAGRCGDDARCGSAARLCARPARPAGAAHPSGGSTTQNSVPFGYCGCGCFGKQTCAPPSGALTCWITCSGTGVHSPSTSTS